MKRPDPSVSPLGRRWCCARTVWLVAIALAGVAGCVAVVLFAGPALRQTPYQTRQSHPAYPRYMKLGATGAVLDLGMQLQARLNSEAHFASVHDALDDLVADRGPEVLTVPHFATAIVPNPNVNAWHFTDDDADKYGQGDFLVIAKFDDVWFAYHEQLLGTFLHDGEVPEWYWRAQHSRPPKDDGEDR